MPLVDGVPLVDLVTSFEERRGYDPAGGYDGISVSSFDPVAVRASAGAEQVWLLGCDCGDAGCWPLAATLERVGDLVLWSAFEQPHRPAWDYDGFGPFRFAASQYDEAVRAIVQQLGR